VDRDSHDLEQFTTGGRPARFGEDGVLWIDLAKLSDGTGSRYVQLALSWPGTDQQTVREWADRFVGQVGEL